MRPLLALFLRSLREDIRSRFTCLVRCLLIALVLFSIVAFSATWDGIGPGGRELMGTILHVDLFILCVVGLSHFASTIAEEKEDGTLGLLRMTELNAFAILIGKFGPRLLNAFLLVVAQLPFALVSVTFGGLHVRQVFAGFVFLLSFAFLTANVGLLASTLCRRTSASSLLTGFSLAGFSLAPFAFRSTAGSSLALWKEATPLAWREEILSTGFSSPIAGWQCTVYLLLGVLAFLVAWLVFDRCSDVVLETAKKTPARGPRSARARPRALLSAILWKDFHFVSGGRAAIVIKGLLVAVMIALVYKFTWQPWRKLYCLCFSFVVPSAVLVAICFSVDAARIFTTERRDRTLPTLLGLPLPPSTIVWEKVFGCFHTALVPIACLCLGLAIFPCALGWEMWSSRIPPNDACNLLCWVLYGGAAMLSLPVLIAWLSLHVRWGAFPIGLTLWVFENWIVWLCLHLLMGRGALSMIPFVHLAILVFFALEIVARLERLAGE